VGAALSREQGLRALKAYQQQYPSLDLLNTVFALTLSEEGPVAAADLVKDELARNPTLLGLDRLLEAQLIASPVERRHDLDSSSSSSASTSSGWACTSAITAAFARSSTTGAAPAAASGRRTRRAAPKRRMAMCERARRRGSKS
jgi:hypothetical protein